ncbi:DUF3012 domain-containing protein [Vibrio parahaemolyticus]|uniref:DUF3012 domain-containing protein n=1 Tax=Vibrio parahaemolyticus TaxID=670 RepID=UPI00040A1758|nr:DUF3012 domain-containing protein [Vibrio parahaemolyticus]
MKKLVMLMLAVSALTACSDEVGTEGWCNDMRDKPKGDWTANEATSFTKHCIF